MLVEEIVGRQLHHGPLLSEITAVDRSEAHLGNGRYRLAHMNEHRAHVIRRGISRQSTLCSTSSITLAGTAPWENVTFANPAPAFN